MQYVEMNITADIVASWTHTASPQSKYYRMHAHDTYELLLFLHGRGTYIVEGHRYEVARGRLMLMRPGEAHRLLPDETEPYERLCFNFSENPFGALDEHNRLLHPYTERQLGENNAYMLEDVEDLMRDIPLERVRADAGEARLRLLLFLERTLLAVYTRFQQQRTHRADKRSRAEEVLQYVNLHLSEPLSLPQTAEAFYMSPAQLERLMNRSVGVSFWKYVTVKRLLMARELLRQGQSATSAAHRCGFEEYSTFYRAYRKQFGRSPRNE